MRPERSFRGALDIVAGAFRFTTGKLKKTLPREVAIRVGTATIGIRGTDIWGKTDKDGDLVALIQGRIEITRAGQATELAQAMTYFDAPAGQAAAVKPLDMETLRQSWRGRPKSSPVTAPPGQRARAHPGGDGDQRRSRPGVV
jgi:hypothetical protein